MVNKPDEAPAPKGRPPFSPAADETPVVKQGKFLFEVRLDVAVPSVPPRATSANTLPFREWFTGAAPYVEDGVSPNVFVPVAFWVEERKVDPEKVTISYQKAKVRAQFNQWQEADEAERDKFGLTTIHRPGNTKEHPEEGLDVWLVLKT